MRADITNPCSDDSNAVATEEQAPLVSVVIATHKRPDLCTRLLHALSAQTLGVDAFDAIVVDDCSGDNTIEAIEALKPTLPFGLTVLQTPANRGPGPARNIGWRAARTEFIAFTDDDCLPEAGWLQAGVEALAADPGLGIAQGRTKPDQLGEGAGRWDHWLDISRLSPYFETCNMFYRRQALEDGGGFGEHHNWWGGWYCEDTFAGWRAVDAGWGRCFVPDAIVIHGLEKRSVRWWIDKSLVLYNEVEVAVKHPRFREEAFWRSWAPRRQDFAFVLGCTGLLLALKWKPAALLAAPYIKWRRPPVHQDHFVRQCVETVAVDSARTLGLLYGAIRHRTFVI